MGEEKGKEAEEEEEVKHRIRMGETVLDGNKDIVRAITKIDGMGRQVAISMTRTLNLDKKRKLGSLSDSELETVEERIKNLGEYVPNWQVNRKKDYETGEYLHLIGTELQLAQRDDIKRLKEMKCYRGVRHSAGLPVRGQRTRTSFRKGTTIGVSRKKAIKEKKKERKEEE